MSLPVLAIAAIRGRLRRGDAAPAWPMLYRKADEPGAAEAMKRGRIRVDLWHRGDVRAAFERCAEFVS